MRITEQIFEDESIIGGLLREAGHDWAVWHDERDKRRVHQPTFLAIHAGTRRVIAVYVRPRPLHLSELPTIGWLPDGVVPVIWNPTMRAQIRAWLANPVSEPPGSWTTTTTKGTR